MSPYTIMAERVHSRHNLQLQSVSARLIDEVVQRVEHEFRGVDLDVLKRDSANLVLFIVELVEGLSHDGNYSKKALRKLDKNAVVMSVLSRLYATLTSDEVDAFHRQLLFVLDAKLARVESSASRLCRRARSFFFPL